MATYGRAFHEGNKYGMVGIYVIGALLILATILVAASTTTTLEEGLNKTQNAVYALR